MAESYRADHVGSLLRPAELLEARASQEAGRLSLDQLRGIEDRAILQALEMQRQVGIDVFSDGEYRRSWFSGGLAESVEGVMDDPESGSASPWQGPQGQLADATTADIGFGVQVVGAKLRQIRRLTAHESGFLKEHAPGPFKVTLPGVMTRALAWYKPGLTDRFTPRPPSWCRNWSEYCIGKCRRCWMRELPASNWTPFVTLSSWRIRSGGGKCFRSGRI